MVTGSLSVFNRQNSQSDIFTIFPEYPSTLFFENGYWSRNARNFAVFIALKVSVFGVS